MNNSTNLGEENQVLDNENVDLELVENLNTEDRIYNVATDKDNLDWRGFLYQLIHDEGLDPWDVDLSILTRKYIAGVREITNVDFDITGKFLTVAVFLLKTKAENLVEKDLRGIEDQIAAVNEPENFNEFENWGTLEELDLHLEELERKRRRENYEIKVRNPIARKRKVNIFDLINLLEKTFKQSNKRKANVLQRQGFDDDLDYEGPIYEENPMDLATIIENLHDVILIELSKTDKHVVFENFISREGTTLEVLEKFMPLLYLHNQDKVYLKQKKHLEDIEIHHKDRVELPYDLDELNEELDKES